MSEKRTIELDSELFELASEMLPEPVEDVIGEYLKLLLHIVDNEKDLFKELLKINEKKKNLEMELFFRLKEKFEGEI